MLVSRLQRVRGYRVNVEVDEISKDRFGSDSGLLEDLARSRGNRRNVLWVDVTAGLQPPVEPPVMDEEQ